MKYLDSTEITMNVTYIMSCNNLHQKISLLFQILHFRRSINTNITPACQMRLSHLVHNQKGLITMAMEQTHCLIFIDNNYKIPTLKNFTRKIINKSYKRKEALRTRDTSHSLNPPQSTPQVSQPDNKKYSCHICNFCKIFVRS